MIKPNYYLIGRLGYTGAKDEIIWLRDEDEYVNSTTFWIGRNFIDTDKVTWEIVDIKIIHEPPKIPTLDKNTDRVDILLHCTASDGQDFWSVSPRQLHALIEDKRLVPLPVTEAEEEIYVLKLKREIEAPQDEEEQ